ncbi:hypothetical protein L9G74_20310, partial [Shewanella sp. C32]
MAATLPLALDHQLLNDSKLKVSYILAQEDDGLFANSQLAPKMCGKTSSQPFSVHSSPPNANEWVCLR